MYKDKLADGSVVMCLEPRELKTAAHTFEFFAGLWKRTYLKMPQLSTPVVIKNLAAIGIYTYVSYPDVREPVAVRVIEPPVVKGMADYALWCVTAVSLVNLITEKTGAEFWFDCDGM